MPLAGAKKGNHYAPVFVREDPLGIGALFAGTVAGMVFARRFGGVSTVFVEVKRACLY